MLFSPALHSFEDAAAEALYQEIDYLMKSEENILDSPGMFYTLISVHDLLLGICIFSKHRLSILTKSPMIYFSALHYCGKMPDRINLRRKILSWLTVSQSSVHGHMISLLLVLQQVSTNGEHMVEQMFTSW
jgi:hypothetical protein